VVFGATRDDAVDGPWMHVGGNAGIRTLRMEGAWWYALETLDPKPGGGVVRATIDPARFLSQVAREDGRAAGYVTDPNRGFPMLVYGTPLLAGWLCLGSSAGHPSLHTDEGYEDGVADAGMLARVRAALLAYCATDVRIGPARVLVRANPLPFVALQGDDRFRAGQGMPFVDEWTACVDIDRVAEVLPSWFDLFAHVEPGFLRDFAGEAAAAWDAKGFEGCGRSGRDLLPLLNAAVPHLWLRMPEVVRRARARDGHGRGGLEARARALSVRMGHLAMLAGLGLLGADDEGRDAARATIKAAAMAEDLALGQSGLIRAGRVGRLVREHVLPRLDALSPPPDEDVEALSGL
jgi:hypothetical protein